MQIQCPQCGFTREIPEEKIPPHAGTATCPKCKNRFPFRPAAQTQPAMPEASAVALTATQSEPVRQPTPPALTQPTPPVQPEEARVEKKSNSKAAKKHDDQHDIWSAVEAFGDNWDKQTGPDGEDSVPEVSHDRGLTDPDVLPQADPVSPESKYISSRVPRVRETPGAEHSARFPAQDSQVPHEDSSGKETSGAFDPHMFHDGTDSAVADALNKRGHGRHDAARVVRLSNDPVEYTAAPDSETASSAVFCANRGSVPWEYGGGFGRPKAFFRTLALSVIQWRGFFAGVPFMGSLLPALVYGLIFRVLQIAMRLPGITVAALGSDTEGMETALTELVSLPVLAAGSVACALALLFFIALVTNIMLRLTAPEITVNFRLSFKVSAYAQSVMLLSVIPFAGVAISDVAFCLLFALGISRAYGISMLKGWLAALPVIVMTVFSMVGGF